MSFNFFPLTGLSLLTSNSIASALPPAKAWETTLLGSRICSNLLASNICGSTSSASKSWYDLMFDSLFRTEESLRIL